MTSPTDAGAELTAARTAIERLTRLVDDFPVSGVAFKDLTPVLADAAGLAAVTAAVAAAGGPVDLVAGIDARGFLIGGAVAVRLGVGVLAVRKSGKLPPPVHAATYDLEYGSATLEIPADGIDLRGARVLVVDDVLATGGTLNATLDLLSRAGAEVVSAVVVIEIDGLPGRSLVEQAHPHLALTSLTLG
ncbi:adenine phosphoribosyltransferase [Williamsia sp. CHRR-6]|uniref:adenine phosphoribosyltransferase n=1 Tax=Williamsia sp. CHRR-6 TaxID=2835871 RepID=UPI001BDB4EA3|nr:adenine phosphoribosyltransferase [Williamsia sp. CHRR-6]MBT0567983.1 adenine phosphoribosyltransferase [Williamsia sp. CHRR-6]